MGLDDLKQEDKDFVNDHKDDAVNKGKKHFDKHKDEYAEKGKKIAKDKFKK